ncbi:MAG: sulfite exporter TauE/SafE family protein [Armatimonadota bacterium]
MYFPIAGAEVSLFVLVAIGFAVGICGGFMGMGGGWMLVPALYALGIPMNIAIGTSLAQILGHAIVSSFRHWQFGNVSLKIAMVMIPGEAIGVEIGASLIEFLKNKPNVDLDLVLSSLYLVLLFGLAIFMFMDVRKRRRRQRRENQRAAQNHEEPEDVLEKKSSLAVWAQSIPLKPTISCTVSDITSISVWVIFCFAIIVGTLTGLLGVGGGILRLPMMIYLFGCPTVAAVGTGLFAIIISGGYGAFTHAVKGNVDLPIALLLFIGAALGAQVGSFATTYVRGDQIRGLFAGLAFVAGVSIFAKTFVPRWSMIPDEVASSVSLVLIIGVTAMMALTILYFLGRGVAEEKAAQAEHDDSG